MWLAGAMLAAATTYPAAACTFPDITIAEDVPPGKECSADLQCPNGASSCLERHCTNGYCTLTPSQIRKACGSGSLCDGEGACVECLTLDDCTAGEECAAGQCSAQHCHDHAQNFGETGTDCGGECAACTNGGGCSAPGDCASGYCAGGGGAGGAAGTCGACTNHSDCAADRYCETDGNCVTKKPLGVSCTGDAQCDSAHCPVQDHLCCEIACDGPCIACDGSKSGGTTGECLFLPANNDPDNECLLACDGSGKCQLL